MVALTVRTLHIIIVTLCCTGVSVTHGNANTTVPATFSRVNAKFLSQQAHPTCLDLNRWRDVAYAVDTDVPVDLHAITDGPDDTGIVRSFDKARSTGFSLTSLPPEILMTLHPFRNGVQLDELSPTQKSEHDLHLFEVGSAVQRSIQRELPKGYVAIASPGQRRQTDRRGSPGVLGALGLAHVDFTESVTLKALLRDSDFGPAWTHRLLESSLYHQLDALFGTGHTDDAHQLFDLVETLNVWAPVDDIVAADPLALSSRAKEARPCRISTKCNEFSVKRQTVSQVVGETGQWFWRPHMRFGEAFVFDSRRTPHAAVKLCHPTSQSAYRNSVEVRVLILRYRPMISSHPGALVTAYLRYQSKTKFYTSRMRCSEAVFEFDQRLRRLRGSTDGKEGVPGCQLSIL